jgi:hypothetical protein
MSPFRTLRVLLLFLLLRGARAANQSCTATLLAGRAGVTCASTDGPVATAVLKAPRGIAADAANNVYISDSNRIRVFYANGTVAPVLGSLADSPAFSVANGVGKTLSIPRGIAVNAAGTFIVFVTEGLATVTAGTLSGGSWSQTNVAGGLPNPNPSNAGAWQDGTGSNALFHDPWGIAMQSPATSSIPTLVAWVADTGNHRIRLVTGSVVTTIAGTGSPVSTDGLGTAASFANPTSIAYDPTRAMLYVGDGPRVRAIAPNGLVRTLAGSGATNAGVAFAPDGIGTAARFSFDVNVAVDRSRARR